MGYVQPGRADVHVDRPLTNISVAYIQAATAFIADRVFPIVPVAKSSDKYFTYDRGMFFRDSMKVRAPGTQSAGMNYTLSTDSYSCDVWALHIDLADQVVDNADSPLTPEREATEILTQQALINREVQWATAFFTTGIWTTDLTGVAGSPGANQFQQWNNAASTPIEDVRTGKRTVHQSTGFMPNKMVLSRPVYDALLDHPDIVGRLDRGQTTGAAVVMRQNLAALFELDEILVMDAIQNTAVEGATNAHSYIAGKNAMLCYAAPTPSLMAPSAGYTFAWTGHIGAGRQGSRMNRIRNDLAKATRIEIEAAYDQKKVAADLGYFFGSAVA